MSEVTLENVKALNAELAALAEVGIPSNFATSRSHKSLEATLEQINSSLTLRTSLGQSLITATADNGDLPLAYRSALESGVRGMSLASTLDGVSLQATAYDHLRSTLRRSLLPPLIVLCLSYLGFIFLCLFYTPKLEAMYEQVGQTPSGPLLVLATLRDWLPYWATALPLIVLVVYVGVQFTQFGWWRLIPGARRYATALRNAVLSRQLVALLDSGIKLDEALPVAAAVTGDQQLFNNVRMNSSNPATRATGQLQSFPPLLRWALTSNLEQEELVEIIRFAAKTYDQAAQRRATVWRALLPALIGAVLGGVIVMAYGLSVFGPLTHMLNDLAY